MAYNPILFQNIYNDCVNIINSSKDKNIKKKQQTLDFALNKVIKEDECNVQEFFAVVHELRTYELLCKTKKKPVAQNDDKPGVDFICDIGNIECVTFSLPKDEASTKILNGCFNVYEAYTPRVSQAIDEKLKKYINYIAKNQINTKLPNIICLNPGMCAYKPFPDDFIHACERILYGLGDETLFIDGNTREEKWARVFEENYKKPNGSYIQSNLYDDCKYEIISGVLLINDTVDEVYKKPILFINPNCKVKIDRRKVRKFLCLVKDGDLKYHYSCNGKLMRTGNYKGFN